MPHEFPRRILAMAIGLTPQVLTETLYALALGRAQPWVPTEIVLLTTQEGANRARLTLLDPHTGEFHRLCAEYGLAGQIHFDADSIHVIQTPDGPMHDMRTPAENAVAADAITAFVRELCSDAEAAVHVSIAGGRKSMGYYLGYALSLFGRAQDRLSHVLVNEPFEGIKDFYFPPRVPRVIYGPGNRPASTVDAVIELAEIPFVRLRDGLPQALLSGGASFGDTVAAASRRFAAPQLQFIADGARVRAGGLTFALPPLLWAWYAMLAQAACEGAGPLRYTEVQAHRLLAFYALVAGRMSASWLALEAQTRHAAGIDEAFFREKRSKLNRVLKAQLGEAAARYCVQASGTRPTTRHGLTLTAAHITLP